MESYPEIIWRDPHITYSVHAREQMLEREVDEEEVEEIYSKTTGVPGKRKNTFELHGVTSHGRHITIVYTERPTGPHVITVINHSKKRQGR